MSNTHVNASGQAPALFSMPSMIDRDTPDSVKTRTRRPWTCGMVLAVTILFFASVSEVTLSQCLVLPPTVGLSWTASHNNYKQYLSHPQSNYCDGRLKLDRVSKCLTTVLKLHLTEHPLTTYLSWTQRNISTQYLSYL